MRCRFVLAQETNAYAVLPESQWRGYREPQEPPAAPLAGTWATPTAHAVFRGRPGGPGGRSGGQGAGRLPPTPKDSLAAALARLGRAFMARDS
jgi:hypothetical protein